MLCFGNQTITQTEHANFVRCIRTGTLRQLIIASTAGGFAAADREYLFAVSHTTWKSCQVGREAGPLFAVALHIPQVVSPRLRRRAALWGPGPDCRKTLLFLLLRRSGLA